MPSRVKLSELKRMIKLADEMREKLKINNRRRLKQLRISFALKRAYNLLNKGNYTQDDVDRKTRVVYRSMQDRILFWYYLMGFLLAGSVMFAAYETYSFISVNWDLEHHFPGDDISNIVNVVYKESNIVSLYNLVTVPDSVGLKNPKQEFNISNDSSKIPPNINYVVHYHVSITELNDNIDRIIDKKYIRYQLTHYDAKTGEKVSEKIGKFIDLPRNLDGTFRLYAGTQERDHQTNFEMIIWIGEDAPNSQQGRAYNFAFKVTAVIGAI